MALGVNLAGLDGVLERIARQPTREMYRQVTWAAPESDRRRHARDRTHAEGRAARRRAC